MCVPPVPLAPPAPPPLSPFTHLHPRCRRRSDLTNWGTLTPWVRFCRFSDANRTQGENRSPRLAPAGSKMPTRPAVRAGSTPAGDRLSSPGSMCGRTTSYTPPQRLAEIFDAELPADARRPPRRPALEHRPHQYAVRTGRSPPVRGQTRRSSDARRLPVGPDPLLVEGQDPGQPALQRQSRVAHHQAGVPHRPSGLDASPWSSTGSSSGARTRETSGNPSTSTAATVFRWPSPACGKPGPTRRPKPGCIPAPSSPPPPAPDMNGIHDRMPVILERADLDSWLRSGSRIRSRADGVPASRRRPTPSCATRSVRGSATSATTTRPSSNRSTRSAADDAPRLWE